MAKKNNLLKRSPLAWVTLIILAFIILSSVNIPVNGIPKEITYSDFYSLLKSNPSKIKSLVKRETIVQGEFTDNTSFVVNIP